MIRHHISFLPPSSTLRRTTYQLQRRMISGLVNSSTVSVAVQSTAAASTIALSAVYRLGLIPTFDRFGRYACDVPLSVPTRSGFYTSRIPLKCHHASEESDIVLGSDWLFASGAVSSDDGFGLLDPPQSIIASLPEGYHWTPNEGETMPCSCTAVH